MILTEKYQVITSLPVNTKNLKRAFVSLSVTLVLCVLGVIISRIFWEHYTHWVYSIKYGTNIEVGWPATLNGWSWWMGIAIIIVMPFMYFMQDWRNPSLAVTTEGLFINQQMIRNTLIPFSNIESVANAGDGYQITFKDPMAVVKQQVFLFKPFVKSNLTRQNFIIGKTHTKGDIERFMEQLKEKVKIA
jgi:hypothetical protein